MVATPKTIGLNLFSHVKSSDHTFTLDINNLPNTPLFGTDGIRGKAGDLLNAPLALQVGFWAGQVLRVQQSSGPVIMGQDTRNSGNMLAMALSAGLTAAGLDVWDLGICPTAGVAHLTSISDAVGGVMISASHNPPEDNGIKFFAGNGAKLNQELQKEIEAGIRGKRNTPIHHGQWGQHYYRPELISSYLESLYTPFNRNSLNGLKIVLDLAYGAAVHTAPELFQNLGATVICLHEKPDGDRINVDCGSTHLDCLQQAVLEHQADLGIAFDGDADRALAVDNQGRVINGDYILYLWGKKLREENLLPQNLIVTTVMANLGFEKAWERHGGMMLRTPVGDQYVQAEMLRSGATLGGEQSGHILCPHYGVSGDGLLTAVHLANLIISSGVSFAELVDESFQTYPQLLKNIRVEDRHRRVHWQECEPLMQVIEEAENAMAGQGRILVRASGTEPLIRVMVEAINSELMEHWADKLVLAVQEYLL
jgi:phosphoglucosamine mutase